MKTGNQNIYLYGYMLGGNSITSRDAMLYHGIGRLASRISDLQNDYGVPITKEREPNSDGEGYHVRYSISQCYRDILKNVPLGGVCETINKTIL